MPGALRGSENEARVKIHETHPDFFWKLYGEDVLISVQAQGVDTFLSEDRVLVISSASIASHRTAD